MEAAPPLFLRASEIIHNKCDLLHFRAFVHILEIHDFFTPASFDDEGGAGESSLEEDYSNYDLGRGILQPWSRVHRLAFGHDAAGDPWLSLPTTGGGASWSHRRHPGATVSRSRPSLSSPRAKGAAPEVCPLFRSVCGWGTGKHGRPHFCQAHTLAQSDGPMGGR
jgi:hypothetical protein